MTSLDGIIIVLGSPNDDSGNISKMGLARAQATFAQHKELPSYKILPTGGYGEHFNKTDKPHAYYLKNYLLDLGLDENMFLDFAESKHTIDDAFKAVEIVKKYRVNDIIVISSDFHMERVRYIFDRVFIDYNLSYLPAAYLDSCKIEEAEKIVAHERQAIVNLSTDEWLRHTEIS